MNDLKVYVSDFAELVIANNEQEAWDIWQKATGCTRGEAEVSGFWTEMDPDKKVEVLELNGDLTKSTLKEWVPIVGKHYFSFVEGA